MKKFKVIKQTESADCGATCLHMIANYYDKFIDVKYLRDITYTNKIGVSLNSLVEASKVIGFNCLPVTISLDSIEIDAPLPAILHWKNTHYVVLYKIATNSKNEKTYYIADPAFGKIKLSKKEVEEFWNVNQEQKGISILLEPSEEFTTAPIHINTKKDRYSFLFSYVKKYKTNLVWIALTVFFLAGLNFIFPYINKESVDQGVLMKDKQIIIYFLLAQLILYTGSGIVQTLQSWIFLKVKTKMSLDIIQNFLLKLLKMPLSFFENKLSTDIIQRVDDHEKIEEMISRNSIQFLVSLISFFVFSVVLFTYSKTLLGIFLVGTVLALLWVLFFHKNRRFINYKRLDLEALNRNKIYEIVHGITDIKINNSEQFKIDKWKNVQQELIQLEKKSLRLENTQELGIGIITQIKNTIILTLTAFMVIDNSLSLGEMLSISFILGQLNAPLEFFILFIYSIQDAQISIERIADIYDKKDESAYSLKALNKLENYIEFKEASFGYSGKNDFLLFDKLNLKIQVNQITAIVGSSGSGKTTLVKILMRFYELLGGGIYVNDQDLSKISFEQWREKIGVVFQDGYIFSDSLKNNIIMSNAFDEGKFNSILEKSNVKEFITRLPQKENTLIGEEGVQLSNGQKQRILIARAMYKNPEILILDEATSALDAENEKIIHDNLQEFFKGKTVVIIAHRLSTVKNADQIIVLKQGQVVEQGNHQQLVDKKGDYFNLVKNQLELGN
ncbi:peptidase domain-containing ABC transporter [Flavobacterium columnare]|uniref:Peptidase domain-containing ABC transporter n=1 Tax=Flavobacterium columnare TaxID=996 RepID=A0A437UBC5_9FLAO|nr:peptidase domain-containing ABC transporter [Flavobacterium columnare]RVU90946.1 peptidase domain-containing ABC transporter [Flavobacterium columnare]